MKTLRYVLPAIAVLLCSAGTARADGVTIITHGWNPSPAGTPAWLASMRDAVAANYLGNEQSYGTITVTKPSSSLVATCSPWNVDLAAKSTGEILIVLDWSTVANHLTGGPSSQAVAAAVVDKIVTGQNGSRPLAELPIHLMGHSRGGGLVAELARLLGERGVVVDQVTLLDPHPLTAGDPQSFPPVIDTPAALYKNVIFADNYWQNNESPTGEAVSGAYHRLWGNMAGGYHDVSLAPYPNHRNIYLMYQGSIDPNDPVNNGEAVMDAAERAAWFNTYEAAGAHTGFYYSRLDGSGDRSSADTPVGGGDAVRAGLSADAAIGGSGARQSLTWSAAAWPNIGDLQVLQGGSPLSHGTHSVAIGTSLDLRYAALDYADASSVRLHADVDRNPYNGNDIGVIGTVQNHLATGATFIQNTVAWDTTGMSAGATVYVYAEISDGTNTRYYYAPAALTFVHLDSCGNGSINPGEACDDGNLSAGDGCNAGCQVEAGWSCPTPGSPCAALPDHYAAYKVKAPKKDTVGAEIPNNVFPKGWVITVDDTHLNDADADDPENFAVTAGQSLLSPTAKNTEGGPYHATTHYLRYQMKLGKESVAAANSDGSFNKPPKHVARVWQLSNELGTINVQSKKVSALLLPAAASLTIPPATPGDATHFVCYQVKPTKDATAQTSDGKLTANLQAFFADQFNDCALDASGSASFQGTSVEGKCLLDLTKVVELCNPMNKSAVVAPRQTTAIGITGSTAGTTKSLLCYGTKLAGTFTNSTAATLAGATVGGSVTPKQLKHAAHTVKNGNPVYTSPANQFPNPTMLDTKKQEMVCVPTDVLGVTAAP